MKPAWPTPAPASLDSFFGRITLGDDGLPTERWENNHLRKIGLPYPMRLAWQPDVVIRKARAHREVAQSLMRCLDGILQHFKTPEAIAEAGLDLYGGTYAYRRTAGTSVLSMHAYGAAIDFCLPAGKEMPIEIVELFEAEGWAWGGTKKKNPEPGHFEAINRS